MTDAFFEELRTLLNSKFTGQVILHVHKGAVNTYEINERRRPKLENGQAGPGTAEVFRAKYDRDRAGQIAPPLATP